MSVGDNDKAKRFFERAISIDENAAAAFYSLGNLYFNENNFDEAKSQFEKAVSKGWKMLMYSLCSVSVYSN